MTTLATLLLVGLSLFVIGAAGVLAAWAGLRWLLGGNSEKDNPKL